MGLSEDKQEKLPKDEPQGSLIEEDKLAKAGEVAGEEKKPGEGGVSGGRNQLCQMLLTIRKEKD